MNKNNCIFCKIIDGSQPAKIVFQDDNVTAFWDVNPIAPVHILIIPNKHIESVNCLQNEDIPLVGNLFSVAKDLAQELNIDKKGYRLVINTGPDGGQSIYHLHLHLVGGRRFLPVFK